MRSVPDLRAYRMVLVALASTLALFIAACGDQAPGDEVVEIEPTDPPEEPADEPEDEDGEDGPDEAREDEAADDGNGDDATDAGNGDDSNDDAAHDGNGDGGNDDDGNGDNGTNDGDDVADADTTGLRAEVELQVPGGQNNEDAEDTEPVTYTLVCDGSAAIEDAEDNAGWIDEARIDAGEACEEAAALLADPPEREPDTMCTQQYGGPHTAKVTVTEGDDEATVDFSRTDGCEINQWDSYDALLGEATVGASVD